MTIYLPPGNHNHVTLKSFTMKTDAKVMGLTKISLHILTLHNKYHTTITNFLRISLTGDIMPPRKLIIKHLLRTAPSHSHKSVRFFLDYCH